MRENEVELIKEIFDNEIKQFGGSYSPVDIDRVTKVVEYFRDGIFHHENHLNRYNKILELRLIGFDQCAGTQVKELLIFMQLYKHM